MNRPLCSVALLYICGILLAQWFPAPLAGLFALSFLTALAALLWNRGRFYLLTSLLVLAGWTNLSWHTAIISPNDLRLLAGHEPLAVTVRGALRASPVPRIFERQGRELWHSSVVINAEQIRLSGEWQPAFGKIIAFTPGILSSNFFTGQIVEVTGVLEPPSGPRADGLFDARSHYQRQGIYYQLRETPSVQAAELLRKAVAAADASPQTRPPRVRIRTRQRTTIRAANLMSGETGPLEPLSVRSYQRWHDELPDKHDEVTTVAGNFQIRTTTGSGELAQATLQLRAPDLHPVEERLEFRNRDWVEIEEMPAELPLANLAAADNPHTAVPAPAPAAAPKSEEFRQPAPAATVGDELAVLVALHHIGADLGDPIEVKRASGQILVAGIGIDPRRREEIQQALGQRPNVVVRFSEPDSAAPQPERPVRGEAPASADMAALEARIEKQAGGRANYERLATDILDSSDTLMSRAYALRRIAERFPRAVEPEMTAADRQVLRDLYREHANALAREALSMERLLKPVLGPLGGRSNGVPPPPAASWQAGTEELFTNARRVETILAVMLGVAPGEAASGNIPSQVLSSLAQLRASAEAYGPAGSAEPQRTEPRP